MFADVVLHRFDRTQTRSIARNTRIFFQGTSSAQNWLSGHVEEGAHQILKKINCIPEFHVALVQCWFEFEIRPKEIGFVEEI